MRVVMERRTYGDELIDRNVWDAVTPRKVGEVLAQFERIAAADGAEVRRTALPAVPGVRGALRLRCPDGYLVMWTEEEEGDR